MSDQLRYDTGPPADWEDPDCCPVCQHPTVRRYGAVCDDCERESARAWAEDRGEG